MSGDTASLISRLEAAEGPDRELDEDIGRAIGWAYQTYNSWRPPTPPHFHCPLPEFTASLDAAVGLVQEGCNWCVGASPTAAYCYYEDDENALMSWQHGATPALALCIAALKAREQQDG